MPHVGKPDMKNGWQVVKVLKMEKHPTGTWQSPYHSRQDGKSCLKIKTRNFKRKRYTGKVRGKKDCVIHLAQIYTSEWPSITAP